MNNKSEVMWMRSDIIQFQLLFQLFGGGNEIHKKTTVCITGLRPRFYSSICQMRSRNAIRMSCTSISFLYRIAKMALVLLLDTVGLQLNFTNL